jgi:hypothetical protein
MRKIFLFEFWHHAPHLETAFELAKGHLDCGDEVHFYFGGHELTYGGQTRLSADNKYVRLGLLQLPERIGARLLRCDSFNFHGRLKLSEYPCENDVSKISSIEDLRRYEYKDYRAGLSVLSSLVSETRCSEPDIKRYAKQIGTMLKEGCQLYEYVRSAMVQHQPDLVYLLNGRFYEPRAVMDAATSLGISFKIHERGASIFKYSLREFMPHDRIKVQKDIVSEWQCHRHDPAATRIAEEFFHGRKRGAVQAWKSFTSDQTKGSVPELPRDKKIVTYYSSSDDEYVAVGDIYKWEHWEDQFSAVLDLVDICAQDANTRLVVRIHPHLAEKSAYDREKWLDLKKIPNILVIPPDSKVDSYALMEASDVIVVAGSTIGIEAVFWGKPAICLGPSLYSELDAVYQPAGKVELEALLQENQLETFPERALPYGYYLSVFGIDFKYYQAEGLSSGRFMGVDLHAVPLPAKLIRLVHRQLARMLSIQIKP